MPALKNDFGKRDRNTTNLEFPVTILAAAAIFLSLCSPLRADVINFPPPGFGGLPGNGIGPITYTLAPFPSILELGSCSSGTCQLFGGGDDTSTGTSSVLDVTSTFMSVFAGANGNVSQTAPVSFTVTELRSPFTVELMGTITFSTFDFTKGELKGTVTITGGSGSGEYIANFGVIDLTSNGSGFIAPTPEPPSALLLGLPLLFLAYRARSQRSHNLRRQR